MELLILLIIALILLAWRINSEMSAIQPPSYPLIRKQQEDQSNSVPTENEEDRMKKHSSVDDSHNDWSADSFSSSSFLDDDDWSSSSDDDIYTDPFYCDLLKNIYPENIRHYICHKRNEIKLFFDDDDRSSIFDDHWSIFNWDD
jgi:hypothetical protein